MSIRVTACPHCGRKVEANEEFCPACGAWLYGGPAWPAPPPPLPTPPPRELLFDDDEEPVPLPILKVRRAPPSAIAGRIVLLVVTLALAATWIWAERRIVAGDDWAYWDHTWVIAALLTLILAGWWLWDAVRRGRRDGWDRAWRVWVPPGMI